jgi:hypothetical protein
VTHLFHSQTSPLLCCQPTKSEGEESEDRGSHRGEEKTDTLFSDSVLLSITRQSYKYEATMRSLTLTASSG